MRILMPVLLAPAIALAVPALADDPKPENTEQGQKGGEGAKQAEPKKICKSISEGTGSRRMKRLCMTPEQWREYRLGE